MKWFESYLSLRKHNLCIGNNISNHHMFTEFRFSFKVASISNIFLPLMLKVVSSAYISISDVKFSSGRSFINIIKSRGPKMDPCGTPYFTGSELVVS
jgi:hypothetical protein